VQAAKAIGVPRGSESAASAGTAGGLAIAVGLHRIQLAQQSSIAFGRGARGPESDASLWQMTPIVPMAAMLAAACARPGNINCSAIEAIAIQTAKRDEVVRINPALAVE
jgi:hypothetical protein